MQSHFLTSDALAERWNLRPGTLSQWRWNGRGPNFLKIGRRILYRLQDIESFEVQMVRQNTYSINYDLNFKHTPALEGSK